MPKTRQQKQEAVADISKKFARAKSVVFAEISGYTMDQANALRAEAKKSGVEVMVTKKTLLTLAAKEAGVDLSKETLPGSTLAAFGLEDEIAPARVLAAFAKKNESIKLSAGWLEGKMVGRATVVAFAFLPTREVLLAKLVGSINAPVSGFVQVLAGNLRGLANVLSSIKDAKGASV